MSCIGIIGAMEVEVAALKAAMDDIKIINKASIEFYSGKLNGKDIVVARSGIGKVNAAFCTQIMIDVFHATTIINTGIAGSLNAEINIGDIVLSTDVLHHDMDAVGFGYPKGQVPQMDIFSFPADERIRGLAHQICEEVNPDIRVFEGRIDSGDQFISDDAVKENIIKEFGGLAVEMEGASIGHTAFMNGVPFLIIRAISDKADGSAQMDYPTFEAEAAKHSIRLTMELVKKI